jgi:TetR/AcrR family transcriptional regulator
MAAIRTKAPSQPGSSRLAPEDTRNRLIRVATALFSQRGFDGVSVKELADSAGVNVSLVSYHFGGKENLYRACLEQFGQERLALAQRVLQPPQTVEELRFRLKLFIEEMLTAHLNQQGVVQIIHRECDMDLPVAQEVFRQTFLRVFGTMVEFFKSAQAVGIVRPDLDPLFIANSIFGSIKHVTQSDRISAKFFGLSISDPDYRAKIIDHILMLNLYGLAKERGSA